jgi:hypothetical protein
MINSSLKKIEKTETGEVNFPILAEIPPRDDTTCAGTIVLFTRLNEGMVILGRGFYTGKEGEFSTSWFDVTDEKHFRILRSDEAVTLSNK